MLNAAVILQANTVQRVMMEAKLLSVKSVSMDISEIHRNTNTNNLPVQKIHDMTFVFSDGD